MPAAEKGARPPSWHRALVGLAVILGLLYSVSLVQYAHSENGYHGFPIDDAWIHLNFARNLAQHGSWSYFPGDPAVSGSTSPLYTMALALGLSLSSDEKLVSYALNLLFQLAFLAALAGWAWRRLDSLPWAAGVVLLVALDGRVGILSVSGMETSLFLCTTSLALYGRAAGRPLLCGAALGVGIWVRPDGAILALALALDLLLERLWVRRGAEPEHAPAMRWFKAAGLLGLLLLGYGAFNLAIGGTVLPNTFAAKTAYYRLFDPWLFFQGQYLGYHLANMGKLVLPLVLLGLVWTAGQLVTRRRAPLAGEAAWVVGLSLAYILFLPFAHRFHRYLIPTLPALVVLAAGALRMLVGWCQQRGIIPSPAVARVVVVLVMGAAAALQLYSSHLRSPALSHKAFAHWCRYHNERHERTGRWLAANTPADAVVATHDVGAIAFYSGRKVVDVVGLMLPEAHRHLHQADYLDYLRGLFKRQRVTHLAVFRNWLEVDNVRPIFRAHPQPELLEVFRWQPGRTHICVPEASKAKRQAMLQLQQRRLQQAMEKLQLSARLDPGSSRTWTLIGQVHEATYDKQRALKAYEKALKLNPSNLKLRAHVARFRAGGGTQ